ncbi:RNA polymerase factor sigma-54 [Flavobacteriales bacterium]|nr:RNA polymerase factor sigma-54 [Flavobacteriales bacterium]
MQRQHQILRQKFKLSPQQIQFLGLLAIPVVDLEKRIEEELEENPTLEESDDTESIDNKEENFHYKSKNSKLDFVVDNITGNVDSLSNFLHKQVVGINNSDKEVELLEYLIDSLDNNGFLMQRHNAIIDDYFIANDILISEQELNDTLNILKSFDPAGVGAKDLQECLIIQLERKDNVYKSISIEILRNYYHEFSNKNFEKIIKELKISEKELAGVYKEIETLNPIPGGSFSINKENTEYVVPDFSLKNSEDGISVNLNNPNKRNIAVNKYYEKLLKETSDAETKDFLQTKIEKAKWFVDALKKRNKTLKDVMETIVKIQKNYFTSGKENDIKPMKLADIAEIIKMDISTISRVTNSKYVETNFGSFLLKDFFSEAYKKDNGDIISTKEIKKKLIDIIEGEDKTKPYTDEVICELLGKEDYHIARRTVAKYREELKIPISKFRRKL